MKRCWKCGETKAVADFAKNSSKSDGLQDSCRSCMKAYRREYYERNKEKVKAKNRKWRAENPEKALNFSRDWKNSNPDRVREYKREWNREQYRTNPEFRLKSLIRARLNKHLRGKTKKVGSAVKDLGCSVVDLISYLEGGFEPGMSWKNHGTAWEIDHIKPLDNFDLSNREHFLEACHFTNLQPLWIEEHKKKTQQELSDEVRLGSNCL